MSTSNYSFIRIGKNTIALYCRSIIAMFIGLYTSRVLLGVIGVDDFGIYNVVGGMVMLFSFLNVALMVSVQRFMNVEMGRGKTEGVNLVFCTSINIQLLMAVVIAIGSEIIGLYLLYNYLSIPINRIDAAFWVLQFSIVTLIFSIISVPYNALIMAKEEFRSFAYIDIFGYLLKFLAVIFIGYYGGDRLVVYALLIMLAQIMIRFIYSFYCNCKFPEAHYKWQIDGALTKKMLSFSSWTTLSGISSLAYQQGVGVLYNAFYGVAINAAVGIAQQVNTAVNTLVNNFTMSFYPQITKSYAGKDWDKVKKLHFTGSKLAFCIMSMMTVPLLLNLNYILKLWLNEVPLHTAMFIRIILCSSLIAILTTTSNTLVRATGKIRIYEITLNLIIWFFFLIIYICLKSDINIYVPYSIMIINSLITSLYIANYSCRSIGVKGTEYYFSVHIPMIISSLTAIVIAFYLLPESKSLLSLCFNVIVTILIVVLCNFLLGLNRFERNFIIHVVKQFTNKILRNES
ncbi:oligosaccharide flippase family protein [Bacteroides xylanisolvens]|jgi:O-antigen/teichoic acid export membrane protein|uniref:oligosaccharide flippase family protein n=1 Tax=Bacteroides xylanisolvens TaxID=371601 RepID=UPI001C383984|nr:oligosaccharide flippase family protein [Bacteroides xylanisolvens]MBV4223338.1 oligosaccharide flippase family protein [Bacteroides xylanisolvens]